MYSLYIYKNNSVTIDELIDTICNKRIEMAHDYIQDKKLYIDMNKHFDTSQQFLLNGNSILFNVLEYSYQDIKSGQTNNPNDKERLKDSRGSIVFYKNGEYINCIIDRAWNDVTISFLNKIIEDKDNIVEGFEARKYIDQSFLTWFLYRVFNHKTLISESNSLSIENIVSFKGEGTNSSVNVQSVRDRKEIMELMSSLLFLNDIEVMNSIQVNLITSTDETYQVKFISKNNQIEINLKKCIGLDVLELTGSQVLITLFSSILPDIIDIYCNDIEWEEDSSDFKHNLLESVYNQLKIILNKDK